MGRKQSHRYRRRVLIAALAGLVVGVALWVGIASAAAPVAHGSVPIQLTLSCGADTAQPVVGDVRYSYDGSTLKVTVSLKGAQPNNTYQVVLEFTTDNGATCG